MESAASAVCFEATPENIAAFLMQHRWAQMSAIAAMDSRTFLTANTGFIDVCPDQEYLIQELLPVYSGVQMGEFPVPELKTVPKETALAEKCPRPDWNYLRWNGYSDKKYQGILSGEALLKLTEYGVDHALELQVRAYFNGGKLSLSLVDWGNGEPEPWANLTTNFGAWVRKDCAFVDVNNLGEGILSWIEENGLGKLTGRRERSGFAVYPEVCFDAERLRELDDYGYQEYSRIFDQANRSRRQERKSGQER